MHWISVTDGTPAPGENVLCYGLRGAIQICRYEHPYKDGFFYNSRGVPMKVTHWMKLPDPPGGK